jgi:hypothetical protein
MHAFIMTPRMIVKKAMMVCLPAADALVDDIMIAIHIPSPVQSPQRLRTGMLYAGNSEDECGQGDYHCEPSAPTVVYIRKMSPVIGSQSKGLWYLVVVLVELSGPGDVLH